MLQLQQEMMALQAPQQMGGMGGLPQLQQGMNMGIPQEGMETLPEGMEEPPEVPRMGGGEEEIPAEYATGSGRIPPIFNQ